MFAKFGFYRSVPKSTRPAAFISRSTKARYPASMAVVETVDQMQVARSTAPGADGQLSCQVCFCARGKGCSLFVPHVNPLKLLL
jgi:hypothetical protein